MDSVTSPAAVYVHVPFCRHRCGYCDFALVANRDHLIPQYLTALAGELNAWLPLSAGRREVTTIFIGGGTPTHLSPSQFTELVGLLNQHLCFDSAGEWTVEANPDTLSVNCLEVLAESGVNRLSLGVQAFDDDCLRTLERSHTAVGACETVRRCAEVIPNLSLDLIFGVPGQTLESWRRTLDTAICLPVSHISTYGLTYESGTPFFTRRQHGRLQPVTDDVEREMYLLTIRVLAEAGFEHYEVSNFARPGFRCRHNLVYWHADEFHAFGPGAARYLNGTRSTNIKSVPRWISAWNDRQEFAIQESETLSPEDRAREALMLGLRLVEGFDVSQFELRFGCSVESLAAEALRLHLRDGMLQLNDGRLRLTSDGRLIADTIIADFL